MPEHVESILFISLSCVGDAVMTTPVLESLHGHFPSARIDIVSDTRSDIIYKHCPYRGEIFIKDKQGFMRGAVKLLKEVRHKRYDLIVDLRTDGLAYLLKGNQRLTKWRGHSYGPHAVQQLMGVIRDIHQDLVIPPAKMWLSRDDEDKANELLAELPTGPWLAMVPGNINPKKIWPAQRYAALGNDMRDKFTAVILDGSPKERPFTQAVARDLKLPCVDLAGRTSLLQAAAILKQASFFVGSDSGPGHIAAAVGTPSMIFFSVDRPERVLPWGNNAHALVSKDAWTKNIPLQDAIGKMRSILASFNLQPAI
jgi:ADP-heptose:LPS heptosyltransferase